MKDARKVPFNRISTCKPVYKYQFVKHELTSLKLEIMNILTKEIYQ